MGGQHNSNLATRLQGLGFSGPRVSVRILVLTQCRQDSDFDLIRFYFLLIPVALQI